MEEKTEQVILNDGLKKEDSLDKDKSSLFLEDDIKLSANEDDEAKDEEDDEDDDEEDDDGLSLLAHLEELRERLIKILVAIGVCSAVCYYFVEDIMGYVTLPAGKLYYMHPTEAFFTYLKISMFAGFLLALPFIFYQIWRFVLPALTVTERTIIGMVVPVSVSLFLGGLAFGFFLVLPIAFKFFLGFGETVLSPMLSIGNYFNFVFSFIFPFGLVFELPLAIVVFARLGFISSTALKEKRRLVIFMSFVIGAVISPTPDIFTQSMIAIPIILLYEISLFIVQFILKK